MSTGESQGDDAWKLLEEKEKDLEIAARIGQSLLELNRELKNRNDFLEESLNSSNETVIQLRHELQLRTSLLHAYAENEDEVDAHSKESVDGLQWQVKKLESDNENLRLEAQHLKKLSSGLEEMERLHITECSKNLDMANEKIGSLKNLLAEKSTECATQSAEVERLLKVVASQTSREKALTTEVSDLREQIDETMMIYDELSKDYAELQEKYTEVLSMLHDTDEELRTMRKSAGRNRTGSVDSLYDSLASELETSDSGLCSVIHSARETLKPIEELKNHVCLQLELENACLKEALEECASSEPIFARPSRTIEEEVSKKIDCGSSGCENNGDSRLSVKDSRLPMKEARSSLLCCVSDMQPSTSRMNGFNDNFWMQDEKDLSLSDEEKTPFAQSFCAKRDLLKSGSSDSLASYEGPKFGEPGKPGTRDLDFSLRKRGIRNEIEQEYARFRRIRGLSPSKSCFFAIPSPKKFLSQKGSTTAQSSSTVSSQNASNCNRMELSTKWKFSSSKGLIESLGSSASDGNIVSRANISFHQSLDLTSRLAKGKESQPNVIGDPPLRFPSDAVKALGLCNISRSFLPHSTSSFNSLHRSDSLSLVGSLAAYDFSLKPFQTGIITRLRPSS